MAERRTIGITTTRKLRKPREPSPAECCGSGCPRCVWDIYFERLEAWEEQRKHCGGVGSQGDGEDDSAESEADEEEERQMQSVLNNPQQRINSVVVKYLDSFDDSPTIDLVTELTQRRQFQSVQFQSYKKEQREEKQEAAASVVDDGGGGIAGCAEGLLHLGTLVVAEEKTPRVSNRGQLQSRSETATDPTGRGLPGDSVEVFVPNESKIVRSLIQRLKLDPTRRLVLLESPFVEKGSFPPWLPLQHSVSISTLFALYLDVTSVALLKSPSLFALLAKYSKSNTRGSSADDPQTTTEKLILEKLAEPKSVTERRDLCRSFPTLLDLLLLFPTSAPPLARLLEVLPPLKERCFSVANYRSPAAATMGERGTTVAGCPPTPSVDGVELCFRPSFAPRDFPFRLPVMAGSSTGEDDVNSRSGSTTKIVPPFFKGHCTGPLVCSEPVWCKFQGRKPSRFVEALAAIPESAPLFLIAGGSGISPLRSLLQYRRHTNNGRALAPAALLLACRHWYPMASHDTGNMMRADSSYAWNGSAMADLLGSEAEEWIKSGVLTKLHVIETRGGDGAQPPSPGLGPEFCTVSRPPRTAEVSTTDESHRECSRSFFGETLTKLWNEIPRGGIEESKPVVVGCGPSSLMDTVKEVLLPRGEGGGVVDDKVAGSGSGELVKLELPCGATYLEERWSNHSVY